MRSFCSQRAFVGSWLLLSLLPGCADVAGKGRSHEPIVTSPSVPQESGLLPPKKANLPELPEGAGPPDKDAPDEFTATPSGLYYRILRQSNKHKPRSYDTVLAHYRGWLNNGTQFDSSYDRGKPSEFTVNKVVPGWTEGLQLVGEGGMIELEIPPRLGYGAHATPHIPGNSTLHFVIELQKIK